MELNKETQELLLAALERVPRHWTVIRAWPSSGMSHIHMSLLSRLLEVERKPRERGQSGT